MISHQTFEVQQTVTQTFALKMFTINKYGRNFKPGVPPSKDSWNEAMELTAEFPIFLPICVLTF